MNKTPKSGNTSKTGHTYKHNDTEGINKKWNITEKLVNFFQKVKIFQKIKNFVSTLTAKNIAKDTNIADRKTKVNGKTIPYTQNDHPTINTHESLNIDTADPYQDDEQTHASHFEIQEKIKSLKNKKPEGNKNEPIYVNNGTISENFKAIIRQDMQNLKDFIPKGITKIKNVSTSTKQIFAEIKKEARIFDRSEFFAAEDKYTDIGCPKHSSATKGNIYHANKINLKYNNYIAAQGPYTDYKDAEKMNVKSNTAYDFIAMLAENDSPISVSLVNNHEFLEKPRNDKLPPHKTGEKLEIPEEKSNTGEIIRKKTVIEKLDEVVDENIGVQVDTFLINGKIHTRVYDLGWKDKTPGDPQRLGAIVVFTEKLRQLPELADRKDNRMVINCNAGVGRTGTFMTIHNALLQYNAKSNTPTFKDVKKSTIEARKNRPTIIQTDAQLETVRTIVENPNTFLKPLVKRFKL